MVIAIVLVTLWFKLMTVSAFFIADGRSINCIDVRSSSDELFEDTYIKDATRKKGFGG
jgi:hypothetical protein